MIVLISCQSNSIMDSKAIRDWFEKGEWKQGWPIVVDESADQVDFAKYYHQNPRRWNKAFDFLSATDFQNIEPGKYELDGESLYANVDQYRTRDEEDTRFETHNKYADIQYLIKGKEYIGVVELSKMQKAMFPYNKEKDITFYSSSENNYRLADSSRFFIFLPDDAHRPCLKVDDNLEVKKIVVKVLLNE
ncbi:YhcH/YjgK/YiaL family protein [Sunxiuqinia sp. A32]|uniref:YhcH/YjgK/YiaL family protein n=1 Tax=Sunxiuqinia sp. A32 TaxID=3461496 RepID=UPI004045285A